MTEATPDDRPILDMAEELAKLKRRYVSLSDWYGSRFTVLHGWAHEKLEEPLLTELFNILANSSPSPDLSGLYLSEVGDATRRAERAEAEVAKLRALLAKGQGERSAAA